MKALVFHGARDIRYEEVETPKAGPGEVLVHTKAVSICGSDSSGYKGGNPMRVAPLIMGHEFSGVIAALGEGVTGLKVGDRVGAETNLYCGTCADCERGLENVCGNRRIIGTTMPGGSYNGAMADYVVVPVEKIMPLPDSVSFNQCACDEPLAITLHAAKQEGDVKGKTVAVFGTGPIGLLTIEWLKLFGAARIIAIDVIPGRLEMAKKCGATDVVNSRTEVVSDRIQKIAGEVDIVFDAAGVPATVNGGVDIVRNGGTVVWIGIAVPEFGFEYKHAVCKEITFKCSYMYTSEMRESLGYLKSGKLNVDQIITGVYSMSEGPRLFEAIAKGESKDIKIILTND